MAKVPTLESSLYLSDPIRIMIYTIRKFFRVPAGAVPDMGDAIISLPDIVSRYGSDPDEMTSQIDRALSGCFRRIFGTERTVNVSTIYTVRPNGVDYDTKIVITFTKENGDLDQIGYTIPIVDGRPTIPDDTLDRYFT